MKPKLLTTLATYDRGQFAQDAVAGVTVAMVALPLSLAIAIASGAPPEAGIATAVVGGLLVSLLGGSRVQVGGPTGAFIVVVYDVIARHGHQGLLLAMLMAGVILLIAGALRAGRLIALVPEPVIEGFTVGIAVIIAASQLKDLLGLEVAKVPAAFLDKLPVLWAGRDTASLAAAAVALACVAAIVALRRFVPRLPGAIVAVGVASACVALLPLPVATIASRYGELSPGLPSPALPAASLVQIVDLLPSALVIAFLAGIESLLSALVADRMIGSKHRSNAELLAQGAANLGSALFGGIPATGAIARTATNIRAGARTPVAGLIHAATILGVMLVAAPVAGRLALPALAAILLVTAWTMSEPHRWSARLAASRADRLLFALTFILTVVADLTVAIAVGVALGLALRLARRGAAPAPWTPPER